MPRLLPPKHSRFKPGQSGNPEGGRRHNKALRKIRRLTAAQVADLGSLIVAKDIQGLKRLIEEAKNGTKSHSVLKVWMAAAAIKGISKGDPYALDKLLERIAGKTPAVIELTGKDGGPIRQEVADLTPEERRAELKRLRAMRKEAGED